MTIHEPLVLGPQFADLTDDTEESVLGSSAHQDAIVVLYDGLGACGRGRGLPWFVGNQMRMIVRRAGQRSVTLSPDILVHPTLGFGSRESILVVADGPPALVIEIASPSTAVGRDLDEGSPSAKPAAYAALGIPEYLVFDPTAAFVKDLLWARRLGPRGYESCEPDTDGRWHSALGISFLILGSLLRVCDQDGNIVPTGPEAREYNRRLLDRVAEQERRNTEQDRQLAALQAELRRLRGE